MPGFFFAHEDAQQVYLRAHTAGLTGLCRVSMQKIVLSFAKLDENGFVSDCIFNPYG